MIKPVNGHLLIEPVTHDTFIAAQHETYQEIGTVVAIDQFEVGTYIEDGGELINIVKVGDKVYFDAWLAAKYPKENGKDGEFYWLVKWEDIRAVEHVEPKTISE